MKKLVFFLSIALIASWALLCDVAFSQPAELTITFDDTAVNDTISVTYNLDASIFQNIQVSSGFHTSLDPYYSGGPLVEYGRITFFVADGIGLNFKNAIILTEPSQDPFNQPISDTVTATRTPGTVPGTAQVGTAYDVLFESDYLSSPLSPELIGASVVATDTESNTPALAFMGVALPSGEAASILVSMQSDFNNPEPIPEPSTFLLFVAGLAGMGILRRRVKK